MNPLGFVRATELAAIAAARWHGKGDGKAADQAAVDEMRKCLNRINFRGRIVIGEGAKDEAAELYVGESVGTDEGPEIDIAVDPLECTDAVARGRQNAISVMVTAPRGGLYGAPDSYMEKIATGPRAAHAIDPDQPVEWNVEAVAEALGKNVEEVTVAVLERERHEDLIGLIRDVGARVQLFPDGDVAMAIATCIRESPIDLMMGIGGSTEAVLAAAAIRFYGGQMYCRWKPDAKHWPRLDAVGFDRRELSKTFTHTDLVKSDEATFTATGVVDGPMLRGVVIKAEKITTHSLVLSCKHRSARRIKTEHFA